MNAPPGSSPLLAFSKVWRSYGEGDMQIHALSDVSFQIEKGSFVAVTGPSGSGKSTAMNILGSLDTPSRGDYYFNGTEAGRLDKGTRADLRNRHIGFVFQGYNLLPRTTALDNVELPLVYRGLSAPRRRTLARRALAQVGLEGREHHTPSALSGGQQQRVAIARALVSEPTLLVADEPTGNLDTERSHEIMTLLTDLNRQQGLTIVMVTHEADIAAFAGRQIGFRDGRIAYDSCDEGMG
ncbi:ABC transporter ATP-binding protein [Nitratireductor sp. B36]|uniref:ABC transporter ATP-binding protein n=1 Tax=Nitratireductor sp. B36 TaxID=2762059 RepID=UPI001E582185|nr:ABC transporter ATP-binding protein [Nitratireductor sp. B36]MCC5779414.1 ABC transporter ATP-binding protein [Nitratireductor sp. B36]